MKTFLQKVELAICVASFCAACLFAPLLHAKTPKKNNETGIEPEVYTRPSAQDDSLSSQSLDPKEKILQSVDKAKAAVKMKDFDEAENIVNGILEIDPNNWAALKLKNKIKDARHMETISELRSINEAERVKNIEELEEKSIQYNDLMRFPKGEDLERVQDRILPDKNRRFEDIKDEARKMELIPSPRKPIPDNIKAALDIVLRKLEFFDASLREVVEFLREKSGINMLLDNEIVDEVVNIKLENVTIGVALKHMLPNGINYRIEDDIVIISNEKLELRVYDVRDLLINLNDYSGGGGGGGSDGSERSPQERVQALMELLTAMVEPETWGDGSGRITTREDKPGDLIIVNTVNVHEQIYELLASMRSAQHLQVNIEARFIQMSDNFLEDIGVELNNFNVRNASEGTNLNANVDTSAGAAAAASQGLNLAYSILKDYQIDLILNAVQESEDAEVLTSPRITLSNTQRGSIRVVEERSYVASYEIISQVPQPVIAVVTDGTTFDVRPIISTDRKHVFLEVHPDITTVELESLPYKVAVPFTGAESTTFQPLDLTIQQPLIRRQELSVTVDVPDRGTLMIGGLGSSEKRKRTGGVPILSKLPLIKRLFSRDSEVIVRSNLIILLKPTILIREEEEFYAKEYD